jgi:hypothetical protein
MDRDGGRSLKVVLLCLLVWLLPAPSSAAPAEMVEQTTAVVTADGSLPPLVQGRMQASVAAIAGQLLDGRRIVDVETSRAQYENIIHEVFDKVLVGYSVERVTLQPGDTTEVGVRLIPWADVIRQVDVKVAVEGMPPEIEAMVRSDMQGVGAVFTQGLNGLPIAAADWTNGVLKQSLTAFMDTHLPEFRADFDVNPETTAQVQVTVYPRLPVVRTVDLNMRSNTVPNFTLLNHRELMQEKVNLMIGVPVPFISRHQTEFCRLFAAALDETADFRAYAMHTLVTLPQIGPDMVVMSRSDTRRYRFRLEGWADFRNAKKSDQNTMLRLHLGQKLSQADEIFIQSDLYPQSVEFDWQLGYARAVAAKTQMIVRYDMKRDRFVLGGERQLSDRWLLRYEYRWSDQKGEAALRYRMHDFLSLEYVTDHDDKWLRLIGNF